MEDSSDPNHYYYFKRCEDWLTQALFDKDRLGAAAAASNLRRALRDAEGADAALIAIGESPSLTERFLPRVWIERQALVAARRAARRPQIPGAVFRLRKVSEA